MKIVEEYQGQRPRIIMIYDRYNVITAKKAALQSVGRILTKLSKKSLPNEATITMAFPSGMGVRITVKSS